MSHNHDHHADTLMGEVIHHIPYAIFSVAFGMIILSFLDFFSISSGNMRISGQAAHLLFHSFHFLHIILAVTGSLVTFSRFSNRIVFGVVLAVISSLFFCTLSDVILPYLAGKILGIPMHFHLCMRSELHNIIPFVAIGLLNGFVLSKHNLSLKNIYSLGSHFAHILISSLASLFYMVSEGFTDWYTQMGIVFVFLIVAVVVPCTFADVIVPVYFANLRKTK